MPQRFGQASDYSATFSQLAYQNQLNLERRAQALDARREEEAAARDRMMFARYQEGKISGGEILDYIRRRISQFSSYDKAKANEWRAVLVQYQTAIADDRAESEYAETGNIHGLIAHYARRLRATEAGTPEYRDLATRLRGLRTERDADDLRRGAQRITNAISRGDATTRDLIEFYQGQLPGLTGDLRQQVLGEISTLRTQRREDLFATAMQRIETRLNSRDLTPQQAASQMENTLRRFDLLARDPSEYWQWLDQVRQLRATPDPAELAKLEFQVANGNISVQQYQDKLFKIADRIAPYDQSAAWQLRSDAIKGVEGATPLPNPEYLATGGNRAVKHISQLDGSRYAQINCTMAAAAMLGHAMGAKGLSGGDLRYLSGDTAGGTTIMQAQYALQQAGVGGTKARYHDRIEFDNFKRRVANGAPAVLSGFNGSIPMAYNNSGIIGGHAMFVAGYDEKKDRFLMMDPAVGRAGYKGEWWPAAVVERFGWGQAAGANYRYGQALFAPRGTLVPGTLKRVKGAEVIHVSVNTPPQRRGTPPSYVGLDNPGADAKNTIVQAEARRQKREQRRMDRRLERAGLAEGIDTVQEAEQELERRARFLENSQSWIDEFGSRYDGTQTTIPVTIGTETRNLSIEDVRQLQREMLYAYDGQEMLFNALGDWGRAADMRKAKKSILTGAAALNTIEHDFLEERLAGEILEDFAQAEASSDPEVLPQVIEESLASLREFEEAGAMSAEPEAESEQRPKGRRDRSEVDEQAGQIGTALTPEEGAESGGLAVLLDMMADETMPSDARIDVVLQWAEATGVDLPKGWPATEAGEVNTGTPLGRMVASLAAGANRHFEVQRGESGWVVINGALETLPTRDTGQVDPMTGNPVLTLDLSALPQEVRNDMPPAMNSSATLPSHVIQTAAGPLRVPVVPRTQESQDIEFLQIARTLEGLGQEGQYLTNDQIAQLGQAKIDQYLAGGSLRVIPFEFIAYKAPPYVKNGKPADGSWWSYDPQDQSWHEGGPVPTFPGLPAPGLPGARYVGVDQTTPPGYPPVPEVEYEVDETSPVMTGVPVGFSGNVHREEMQRMQDQGLLPPPAPVIRDGDGNIVPRQPNDRPVYSSMQTVADSVRKMRDAMVGLTSDVRGAVNTAVGNVMDDIMGGNALTDQGLTGASPDLEHLRRQFGIEGRQDQKEGFTPPAPPQIERERERRERPPVDELFGERRPGRTRATTPRAPRALPRYNDPIQGLPRVQPPPRPDDRNRRGSYEGRNSYTPPPPPKKTTAPKPPVTDWTQFGPLRH